MNKSRKNPKGKRVTTRKPKGGKNGAVLDVKACAHFLGCSEKTVRARVARGQLPARRLGGTVVFVRSELERYLEQLPEWEPQKHAEAS